MAGDGWTPKEFKAIYVRHVRDVYRFFSARVGATVAEELTAQTFLEAWGSRARYDPDLGTELAWLRGIALNLARRHHRNEERKHRAYRTAARRDDTLAAVSEEEGAVDRLDARRTWGHLAEDLDAMSEAEQEILVLYACHDLSYQDIADRLDIPIGTVRSRLSRGRARLVAATTPPRTGGP